MNNVRRPAPLSTPSPTLVDTLPSPPRMSLQHAPRPQLRKETDLNDRSVGLERTVQPLELEEPLELGDGASWEGRPPRKRQQPSKYHVIPGDLQEASQPRKGGRRKKEVLVPPGTGDGGGRGGGGGGGDTLRP